MGPNPTNFSIRFLTKVNKTGDCWLWTGNTNNTGYGMIWDNSRKTKVLAHRASYEFHNNVHLEKGVIVLHTCDNPACVNPEHLKIGTRQENAIDMVQKGRSKNQKFADYCLTDEQALAIREEYAATNISQEALAVKYRVNASSISLIILGKSHKRAGGPVGVNKKQRYLISPKEWIYIKAELEGGRTQKSLAQEFGVCKQAIAARLLRERERSRLT